MLSKKSWQPEFVMMFCAAMLACYVVVLFAALVLRMSGPEGFKTADDTGFVLLGTLGIHGPACVFAFIFVWLHRVNWRDALGLRGPGLIKTLLTAAGFLLAALPVVLCLQQLAAVALERMGWPPEDQEAVEMFVNAKSVWMRGYLAVFAVVIAPVAEEVVFRGILFPFLKEEGWPKLAWIGVSFLFALIHVNAPTLLPLFAFALVLTWLYERTDRLIAPIFAHSLFNGVNLIILYTQHG